jgi:hypothetical protein
MATPADRMHTAPGLGARSSNQQRGRGVYEGKLESRKLESRPTVTRLSFPFMRRACGP